MPVKYKYSPFLTSLFYSLLSSVANNSISSYTFKYRHCRAEY
nr:MAG TPA: hypothetical protein [Caudoviricetes sp.]